MSEYNQVVQKLAPCGLDCSRCADFENGAIRELAAKLARLLKGYERLAKIKAEKNPAFADYEKFKDILNSFAEAACGGCRSDNVKCPIICHAQTCHKEKKVDFCFQCAEYPCEKQFEGKLRERWINMNDRMKEIGVINYYLEQSKLPRY
ncbi:MAG: DUF3795 domain-containing protein [Firmicutes bacterium]|nr:DUF3795 domain-containing protein [Bacillota bacterium]